jgi:archaellum component FlaC
MINDKINNLKSNNVDSSVNDLIIKNNIYINDRLDCFNDRLDNIEFGGGNQLRADEIIKIKSLIHSQDDTYKYINNDIKEVKNDCNLLRNKLLDNYDNIIDITKNI